MSPSRPGLGLRGLALTSGAAVTEIAFPVRKARHAFMQHGTYFGEINSRRASSGRTGGQCCWSCAVRRQQLSPGFTRTSGAAPPREERAEPYPGLPVLVLLLQVGTNGFQGFLGAHRQRI